MTYFYRYIKCIEFESEGPGFKSEVLYYEGEYEDGEYAEEAYEEYSEE